MNKNYLCNICPPVSSRIYAVRSGFSPFYYLNIAENNHYNIVLLNI